MEEYIVLPNNISPEQNSGVQSNLSDSIQLQQFQEDIREHNTEGNQGSNEYADLRQETFEEPSVLLTKKLGDIQEEINRLQKAPECSQTFLLLTLNFIQMEQLTLQNQFQGNIAPVQILESFQIMIKLMSQEDFIANDLLVQLSNHFQKNQSTQSMFAILPTLLQIKEAEIKVDIGRLRYLLEKNKEASDYLKDQDVIIFLGNTGNGKSTTIHFLAGSVMKSVKVGKIQHIQPVEITNEQAKAIHTNPFTQSVTKFLSPVSVTVDKKKQYVLLDSPGFEDTEGALVDLINGISVIDAIKSCKTVRPIIVISYKMIGDRLEGLRKLAYVLSRMITSMEDQIELFQYVFTKFPEEQKEGLGELIADLKNRMNESEQNDTTFMSILDDLIEKLEDNKFVYFIDPLHDKPEKVLRSITKIKEIKQPNSAFKYFLTDKSSQALHAQCQKIKEKVMIALQKQNFRIINLYLNDIQFLTMTMKQDLLNNLYKELLSMSSVVINKSYDDTIKNFEKFLKLDQNLTIEEIQHFLLRVEQDLAGEDLKINHLQDYNVISNQSYSLFIINSAKNIQSMIQNQPVYSSTTGTYMDKLKLLSNSFYATKQIYEETILYLFQGFKELIEEFIKNKAFDFERLKQLQNIQKARKNLKHHLEISQLKEQVTILNERFRGQLSPFIQEAAKILSNDSIDENSISNISSFLIQMQGCKNLFQNQKIISLEIMEQTIQEIRDLLNSFSIRHLNEIERILELKDIDLFEEVQKRLQYLILVRSQITEIQQDTSEIYYKVYKMIVQYITDIKQEIQLTIHCILNNKQSEKYQTLQQLVTNFKKVSWIDNFEQGLYNDCIVAVQTTLSEVTQQLRQKAYSLKIDLKKPQNLKEMANLTYELKQIQSIDIFSNQDEKTFDAVINYVSNEANIVFRNIENDLDDSNQRSKTPIYTLNISNYESYFSIIDQFIALKDSQINLTESFIETTQKSADLKQIEIPFYGYIFFLFGTPENGVTKQMIEKQIQHYGEYVHEEIQKAFKVIQEYDNKNKKQLSEQVFYITQRLSEIKRIEKESIQFKMFFFQDQNIFAIFMQEVSNYLIDIQDKMDAFHLSDQMIEFKKSLHILQELKKLDQFIVGETFKDAYSHYFKIYLEKHPKEQSKIYQLIADHKFRDVKAVIQDLKNNSQDPDIQRQIKDIGLSLNNAVEDLIQQTMSLGKRTKLMMTSENGNKLIEEITFKLGKLKECKDMQEFIQTTNIEEHITQIKKLINENFCQQLKQIEEMVQTNNFFEAENQYKIIEFQFQELGSYANEDLIDKIQKFNEKKKQKLDKIITQYQDMKQIVDIMFKPAKEVYNKLKKLENIQIYHETISKFDDMLNDKFMKELEMINNESDVYEKKKLLNQTKACLESLPENLKNTLTNKIQSLEQHIVSDQELFDHMLKDSIENKDIEQIETVLKKQQWKKHNKTISQIQEFMKKEEKLLYEEIKEQLLNNGFKLGCQQSLKQYLEITQIYSKYFSQEFVNMEKLKQNIQQRFVGCLQLFKQKWNEKEDVEEFKYDHSFDAQSLLENENDILDNQLVSQLNELVEFIKFRNQEELYLFIIPKFDSLFKKESLIFEQNIQNAILNFEDHLAKKEFEKLLNYSESIKKYSILIKRLKSPLDSYAKLLDQSKDNISAHNNFIQRFDIQELTITPLSKNIYDIKLLLEKHIKNKKDFTSKIQRKQYYTELNKFLVELEAVIQLISQKEKQKELKYIEDKIIFIQTKQQEMIEWINKFTEESVQNETMLKEYESCYQSLKIISKNVDSKFRNPVNYKQLKNNISQITKQIASKCKEASEYEQEVLEFVALKRISTNMLSQKLGIDKMIDEILAFKYEKRGQLSYLTKLKCLLEKEPYGQLIVAEHATYKAFQNVIFSEKTQKNGIKYVLDKIDGDKVDHWYLQEQYKLFEEIYESEVKSNLAEKDDQRQQNIQKIASKLLSQSKPKIKQLEEWTGAFKQELVKNLAYIFAILTLSNSQHYFQSFALDNRDSFLLKPHAAQVIAIFRMIGLGTYAPDGQKLINNLVQIGTGEGKSITLAITACLFSLLGFDVYCACYSSFLSQRDLLQFQALFEILQVDKSIHYGTFNDLCERVIKSDFDIRQVVQNVLQNKQGVVLNNQQTKPQVLLIDEVDVFFSMDFYGETYSPVSQLKDPHISQLVDFIWQNKKDDKIKFQEVSKSEIYQQLLSKYGQWSEIITEAVKDIINDLSQFRNHQYEVKLGKIGYKHQDHLVFNQQYGYKTMFAYYHEFEKKEITQQTLDQQKYISIKCGHFSYAEIPKQFSYILGVTGTLSTLTNEQLQAIETEYKISIKTYLPSVFGANQLKFYKNDDLIVCNRNDYFRCIMQEIKKRFDRKRAVLVFFEDQDTLMKFYESKDLEPYQDKVKAQNRILTEDLDVEEKNQRIKLATQSQAITLLTRSFGRGTDFIQRDLVVKENGGVHVLQTFFSEDYSEEVQIKGRTARQGDEGSYSMVVLEESLDKFSINPQDKQEHLTYDFIHAKQGEKFKVLIENNFLKVRSAQKDHAIAETLLKSIKEMNWQNTNTILLQLNKGVEGEPVSRTIVLMDATGSMGTVLEKTKSTVESMFEGAQQILKSNGLSEHIFELQLAAYRNYSSGVDSILQFSTWTSKPKELKQFLSNVFPSGGQGAEAIEVGLWHALNEHQEEAISQIILIGDAPPNSRKEMEKKRKGILGYIGVDYWANTKYATVKYYKEELARIIQQGIPVHAFHVNENAQPAFEGIAQATKGKSEYLDIDSPQGAEQLTHLVTEEILRNVGQKKGLGNKLAEEYHRKYYS